MISDESSFPWWYSVRGLPKQNCRTNTVLHMAIAQISDY